MPFDLTSDEKIVRWRLEVAHYQQQAASARTDQERDSILCIVDSYERLIESEEALIAQRQKQIIRDNGG
jgi:hypothetical protein